MVPWLLTKQATLSLCWTAGSIKSQQTFQSRNWQWMYFACLCPRPAGGNQLPHTRAHTYAHTRAHTHTHTHIYTHTHRHTHNTEGIWAARQLRGIEARSICTGVTQMTINNTVLMTVAVATAHHVSSLVGFPPLRTCIILEGKHSSVFALIIHTFP